MGGSLTEERQTVDLKGHYHCHGCSVCPQTLKGPEFISPDGFAKIHMKHHTNCLSN